MQIDKRTHTQKRDRIREAIADAEVELSDSAVEQIDVDGIMGFAETVLQNAAKLWKQSDSTQRQQPQRELFPEGLTFNGEEFGAAVTF